MRPGVNISVADEAVPSSVPTDVGVGFMVGITQSGPLIPTKPVRNMTEYESVYGARSGVSITTYDSAKLFFDEGGYMLYVGRVVGPGAVVASIMLTDATANNTLQALAKGPGDYGNAYSVVIRTRTEDAQIPVGMYKIRVQQGATILEESPNLEDDAGGILWGDSTSKLVRFVDQASASDPAAGTRTLTGGTLDAGNIDDNSWSAGLASFSRDLGPGQMFAPGRTTDNGHDQLADFAEANRRVPIFDYPNVSTVATLQASAIARRTRYGGGFAPWVRTSGVTVGSSRLVPPSAGVAGIMARNDGLGLSPNEPAAGENGIFRSALSITQNWSDSEIEALNASGVNVILNKFGNIEVYGYRTTADPNADPNWINLGNSRLYMAISAGANAVAERYMFKQIDGERKLINEFGGALIGEVMLPLYRLGSLYGATPDEAFSVDVGENVNTPDTIRSNTLRANITSVMSPFTEEIDITIIKQLIPQEA